MARPDEVHLSLEERRGGVAQGRVRVGESFVTAQPLLLLLRARERLLLLPRRQEEARRDTSSCMMAGFEV